MKWLVLFNLAGPVYGKAQSLKLREIHKGPVARCYCMTDSAFSYPIFGTGNRRVDSAINAQVRSQVLEADSEGYSLRKAVQATIKQGMSYLSYEITFRNANFLSIKMEGEWDGEHIPTRWNMNSISISRPDGTRTRLRLYFKCNEL
ncbi:MAG TPA: hypothetical protein VN616_04615 [Puia sp.]|nr:hypothetical protein [Puia sp.]